MNIVAQRKRNQKFSGFSDLIHHCISPSPDEATAHLLDCLDWYSRFPKLNLVLNFLVAQAGGRCIRSLMSRHCAFVRAYPIEAFARTGAVVLLFVFSFLFPAEVVAAKRVAL